jgi:hypothetical protein
MNYIFILINTSSLLWWILVAAQICRGHSSGIVGSYLGRMVLEVAEDNIVVCITEAQCKEKFLSMGTGGAFLVGEYPTKGCFSKNSNVYFGTGAMVEEELAVTDLPGIQERIWCDSKEADANSEHPSTNPTQVPTAEFIPTRQPATQVLEPTASLPPDDDDVNVAVICSQDQCREKFLSLEDGGRFIVGDFPTKGCFSKKSNVYYSTGSATNAELIENDLPGAQTRLWCEREETESPTLKPSTVRQNITDSPTFQPSTATKPATRTLTPSTTHPTGQPTLNPVTLSPTSHPSQMPIVTKQPTQNPTSTMMPSSARPTSSRPVTVTASPTINKTSNASQMHSPTKQPTQNPTSMMPSSARPTSSRPVTVTASPTINKTSNASQMHSPTKQPTHNPTSMMPSSARPTSSRPVTVTASPTINKTSNASQMTSSLPVANNTSPSNEPSTSSQQPSSQIFRLPTSNPTQKSNTIATAKQEEQASAATISQSIRILPFVIALRADPQTESIDFVELRFFILHHILNKLEEEFPSIDGSSSYVIISSVVLDSIRRLQQTETDSDSNSDVTLEFGIAISGVVSFSGDPTLSAGELDDVTRESFVGASGEDFVRSLQNANDDGLESIRSVSVVKSSSSEDESKNVVMSQLVEQDDLVTTRRTTSSPWYMLCIVFSVGLVLVAMHVMKTYLGAKSSDDEVSCIQFLMSRSKLVKLF